MWWAEHGHSALFSLETLLKESREIKEKDKENESRNNRGGTKVWKMRSRGKRAAKLRKHNPEEPKAPVTAGDGAEGGTQDRRLG